MRIHADDFGITEQQAQDILLLCATNDHEGTLNSVSILANSPFFESVARTLKPAIKSGKLEISLHINLVEGQPCAPANEIPLLLNKRGTFKHDFIGLLLHSLGSIKTSFYSQIVKECTAQIKRYLEVFPEQQHALSIDSHQHTHAIPLIFNALLEALSDCNCTLSRIRIPTEDISLYKKCGLQKIIPWQNRLKIKLINYLCRNIQQKIPSNCTIPLFCGIGFSGEMFKVTDSLINALQAKANSLDRDVELLFHPVSVPIEKCLDPLNKPFAQACASNNRDREAQKLREMK